MAFFQAVIRAKRQPDKTWNLRLVCGHVIENFEGKGSGRLAPQRAECKECGTKKPKA